MKHYVMYGVVLHGFNAICLCLFTVKFLPMRVIKKNPILRYSEQGIFILMKLQKSMMPETGLEPVQLHQPGDFKSPVSTISTIPATC